MVDLIRCCRRSIFASEKAHDHDNADNHSDDTDDRKYDCEANDESIITRRGSTRCWWRHYNKINSMQIFQAILSHIGLRNFWSHWIVWSDWNLKKIGNIRNLSMVKTIQTYCQHKWTSIYQITVMMNTITWWWWAKRIWCRSRGIWRRVGNSRCYCMVPRKQIEQDRRLKTRHTSHAGGRRWGYTRRNVTGAHHTHTYIYELKQRTAQFA